MPGLRQCRGNQRTLARCHLRPVRVPGAPRSTVVERGIRPRCPRQRLLANALRAVAFGRAQRTRSAQLPQLRCRASRQRAQPDAHGHLRALRALPRCRPGSPLAACSGRRDRPSRRRRTQRSRAQPNRVRALPHAGPPPLHSERAAMLPLWPRCRCVLGAPATAQKLGRHALRAAVLRLCLGRRTRSRPRSGIVVRRRARPRRGADPAYDSGLQGAAPRCVLRLRSDCVALRPDEFGPPSPS